MSQKSHDKDGYFESYEDMLVHELMLKDEPRIKAYKQFMDDNKEMFEGKVVVDVGAGMGILSLLAANAGAKQVFAIEASNISDVCRQIIAKNGYSDRITVIHGTVEEVVLPDDIKADILISEWMGFYLFHESMLGSVIKARDRFLSPDGVILPSTANLYICPVAMKRYQKEHFDYWKNVYGFDFSPALPLAKAARLSQPQITNVELTDCLADPYLVISLDLMFAGEEEIKNIYGMPQFAIEKNDILLGFACWFDVQFEGLIPVMLSTGPGSPPTHWCQTVILLPDALLVSKGETVCCRLQMSQDEEKSRRYNISIEIPEAEEDDDKEDGQDELMSEADGMQSNDHTTNLQCSIQEMIQKAMTPM